MNALETRPRDAVFHVYSNFNRNFIPSKQLELFYCGSLKLTIATLQILRVVITRA